MFTDDDKLDAAIRVLTFKTILALYKIGFEEIHIGGLMRIMGISNESASEHDDELIELDETFAKYCEEVLKPNKNKTHTIH